MLLDNKTTFFSEQYLDNKAENDLVIAGLDPLNIDKEIQLLPDLNRMKATDAMIRILYKKLPYPDALKKFSWNESIAAMRDLGFFLGSLKRHNVEPVEAVPELDYILDVLGSKTNLPPRDTLMHYTIWNPKGERRRTYTHYEDELSLIDSVLVSYRPLIHAIYCLIQLHELSLKSVEYPELCEKAGVNFKKVIDGIVLAKRRVAPEIFANELRLYFDPIKLHNREIIGPGAVEMPMFVYDHLLWSSDVDNKPYTEFKSTYLPFSLPEVRDIYYNYLNQPSLITKACKELTVDSSDASVQSAKALQSLGKLQMSFRMPHKKLADKSYESESKDNREKGSGGYSPSVLGDIISLNKQRLYALFEMINHASARSKSPKTFPLEDEASRDRF